MFIFIWRANCVFWDILTALWVLTWQNTWRCSWLLVKRNLFSDYWNIKYNFRQIHKPSSSEIIHLFTGRINRILTRVNNVRWYSLRTELNWISLFQISINLHKTWKYVQLKPTIKQNNKNMIWTISRRKLFDYIRSNKTHLRI